MISLIHCFTEWWSSLWSHQYSVESEQFKIQDFMFFFPVLFYFSWSSEYYIPIVMVINSNNKQHRNLWSVIMSPGVRRGGSGQWWIHSHSVLIFDYDFVHLPSWSCFLSSVCYNHHFSRWLKVDDNLFDSPHPCPNLLYK